MRKLLLSSSLLLFLSFTTVVLANEMENEYGTLSQKQENNQYQLIFSQNKNSNVLQEYRSLEDMSSYLYKNIVIYNGLDSLGLYIYDINNNKSYLLNREDAFFYDFDVKDDQLYVAMGIDGLGASNFCLYDLEKLAEINKEYNLNDHLEVDINDSQSLKNFIEGLGGSFCMTGTNNYHDFQWLENQKIKFKSTPIADSVYGTYNVEFPWGDVYEANDDGSNLHQTGVFIGEKEIADLFRDIDPTYPLYKIAYFAKSQGWLNGYPDGTLRPNDPVNRAEFAKMVIKAFGETEIPITPGMATIFPDAPAAEWYANTLYTALQLGVMTGYPDGLVRPENNINKVEGLRVALEMLGKDYSDTSNQYNDTASDQWYSKYTTFSINQEPALLPQDDLGNLYPNKELTRGEAIELISKVLVLR